MARQKAKSLFISSISVIKCHLVEEVSISLLFDCLQSVILLLDHQLGNDRISKWIYLLSFYEYHGNKMPLMHFHYF